MDLETAESMIKLMQRYGVQEMELADDASSLRIVMPAVPGFPMPSYVPQPSQAFAQPIPSSAASSNVDSSAVRKAQAAEIDSSREAGLIEVRSPFVGTYYAAPAPGADDFVHEGKRVNKGDTLCIVEAMKLMNEIESDRAGTIVKILVKNEAAVEFDQLLFLIRP